MNDGFGFPVMKHVRLEPFLDFFHSHVESFHKGTPEDVANIDLKKDHSLRVLEEAQSITRSLDLAPGLAGLCHVAALFHDLGRFTQYAKYHTFNDKISEDHGRLGLKVLRQTGILKGLSPKERSLVQTAVLLHNRRFLPRGLRPDAALAVRVVRDADKLDIFPVLLTHFAPNAPLNLVVMLNLKPHETEYTPGILAQVMARGLAEYNDMVWINDFKLLICSWVYDLNFPATRRAVLERGYLDTTIGLLPDTPEFTALGERLKKDLSAKT
ncbi:MAG: HD domain-containing protein [Thermodesulfobacteriota bacterium]|nr:HD domain-containing protein [Thermodesulfobacteriota bacterium]